MRQCILLRHGETDLAGRFCGHSDPPLNDAGREQIRRVLGDLAGVQPGAIYCSDLKRARESAQIVGECLGREVVVRPGLREIGFGAWEGLSWGEIEDRYCEEALRWVEEFPRGTIPGGEPFERFRIRVGRELESLWGAAEERTVLVVTHGGFMRTALTEFFGVGQDEASERCAAYASVVSLWLPDTLADGFGEVGWVRASA